MDFWEVEGQSSCTVDMVVQNAFQEGRPWELERFTTAVMITGARSDTPREIPCTDGNMNMLKPHYEAGSVQGRAASGLQKVSNAFSRPASHAWKSSLYRIKR